MITLLLPLCGTAGDGFTIKGKVSGIVSGYAVVLPLNVGAIFGPPGTFPERVRIINGEFTYAGRVERAQLVTLKISTRTVRLFLENVNYEVECSLDSLTSEKVKGGKMHAQYLEYVKKTSSVREYFKAHATEELAPYIALFNAASSEDVMFYYNLLTPEGKNSYEGKILATKLDAAVKTEVGRPFPVFKMTDDKGKTFTANDMRGKLVVFDFWASWCAPCIAYIPKLREHYKMFKDKDVMFVSVSVDDTPAAWTKAMNDQGMEWKQVLAEGGFKTTGGVRKLFNIPGIPYVIIVDKQGKIAASLDYEGKEGLKEILNEMTK
jgi:thiol-disulfide isomerase/thioredoxin